MNCQHQLLFHDVKHIEKHIINPAISKKPNEVSMVKIIEIKLLVSGDFR